MESVDDRFHHLHTQGNPCPLRHRQYTRFQAFLQGAGLVYVALVLFRVLSERVGVAALPPSLHAFLLGFGWLHQIILGGNSHGKMQGIHD